MVAQFQSILVQFFSTRILSMLALVLMCFGSIAQNNHQQSIDSANVAKDNMQFRKALYHFEDALKISQAKKNKVDQIYDLIHIGEIHQLYLDDMDQGLESFMEALRLSEPLKIDSISFEIRLKLAFYYIDFEDLPEAEKYAHQLESLTKKLKAKEFLQRYYILIGQLERRKNNYEASIEAYKNALELSQGEISSDRINSLINVSTACVYAEKIPLALYYLEEAQEINEVIKDDWYSLVLKGQFGRSYFLQGNINRAISYYTEGLAIAKEIDNGEMLRRFNRELARSYAKLGDYKTAYGYYADFVDELEDAHEREKSSAIAEMRSVYEHDKDQAQIETLEKERILEEQIHQSQIERRNLWIFIVSVLTLMISLVSVMLFRYQRNKQRLKLQLVENQKEIDRQIAEMKGQEEERNRLSRELHDGLGGTLASIKMRLSSSEGSELPRILGDLDAACQDIRNMSHSLSSSYLKDSDFYSLLQKLANEIRMRSALDVNLEFLPVDELNSLHEEIKHQCYRIVQELTNNSIKHARANRLTVGLMKNENDVILLVEDDGIGFDLSSPSSGIGIKNVQQRVDTLNGQMDVSTSEAGTTFTINFPFRTQHES